MISGKNKRLAKRIWNVSTSLSQAIEETAYALQAKDDLCDKAVKEAWEKALDEAAQVCINIYPDDTQPLHLVCKGFAEAIRALKEKQQ